jgi:hypothetical protein
MCLPSAVGVALVLRAPARGGAETNPLLEGGKTMSPGGGGGNTE